MSLEKARFSVVLFASTKLSGSPPGETRFWRSVWSGRISVSCSSSGIALKEGFSALAGAQSSVAGDPGGNHSCYWNR